MESIPPQPDGRRRWRPTPLIVASAALHLVAGAAWPRLRPAARERWWRPLTAALAANHALLSLIGTLPRSRALGPNIRYLRDVVEARDTVGLSFDDGPDPEITPRVLDRLDDYGATASFFVIGERARAHPELVRDIVGRGHRVENHTDSHPHAFAFYGMRSQGREIDRAQRIVEQLTGRRPEWFRAPAGIRNPLLEPVLASRGLHLVSWTRRAYDTVERRPARVAHRLLDGLAAGDLLLLHDGAAAGIPPRDHNGQPVVLDALPRVLDQIAARGWQAVALPSAVG